MKYYDQIAPGYDELYRDEQLQKLQLIKNNLQVGQNELLLDVGCGSGISTSFDCFSVGIDPSYNLLPKKGNFIQAKAEALPFKDKTFDNVISVTAIHNFLDFERALNEMKRVGKDRFVISVFKRSNRFDDIVKEIKKRFRVQKSVDEEKDLILFLRFQA